MKLIKLKIDGRIVPLSVPCPYGTNHKRKCPECGGTGFHITENGQAILDLIERHGYTAAWDEETQKQYLSG